MNDTASIDSPPRPPRPRALVGWRLLSLVYDLLPVVALWMLLGLLFTLGYTFLGHHPDRENIPPGSLPSMLLFLSCLSAAGLYATLSWRRGGQTLGMRPLAAAPCRHRWRGADLEGTVAALRGGPAVAAGRRPGLLVGLVRP